MSNQIKIPATLSYKNIYFLIYYFSFLLLLSSITTLYFILKRPYLENHLKTVGLLLPCITFSVCASCIYYIRKLYKLCLANKIKISTEKSLAKLGTLTYFFIRPIFAGIFSIVLILGLNSGFMILGNFDMVPDKIFYLYIVISFFVGFSSGKFLSFIEKRSEDLIDNFS